MTLVQGRIISSLTVKEFYSEYPLSVQFTAKCGFGVDLTINYNSLIVEQSVELIFTLDL